MTFRDWQSFVPLAAARELHHRVRTRLSPPQQRAVIAQLPSEENLAAAFTAADRTAPLGAVPFFLKDLFDLAGAPTFAGSTFLPEVRPARPANAPIVDALRAAGAVCAGKTHLHEFAYGITGENPHYGDCEHPHFSGRTTGGSSSGSAAIVAAGIAPLAIGTDTGGSMRVPAAFCGLFGFRLTPRDRFIADAFPLAPSFDTAGWFTPCAEDMRIASAALLSLSSSSKTPRGCYLEWPDCDPEIAAACASAAARFTSPADAATRADLLSGFKNAVETYSTIVAAEAWATHAPFADRFHSRYDPAVWQRLQRGRSLAPSAIEQARAAHAATQQLWAGYFRAHDFLILPATPCAALTKAECTLENRQRLLALTAPASLGGLPVLTIPVALPSGLTTGLQIVVREPRSPVIAWILTNLSRA